jgi:hypothetical protein
MRHLVLAFLVLAAAAGCSNKLSGSLDVDGKTFELDSCRSGQVYGFSGVELRSKAGDKIRLVQTPTGEGMVVLFSGGSTTGSELGRCGPFTVNQQNSTINDIKNVEGKATLDCTVDGHTVKGEVSFGNCH